MIASFDIGKKNFAFCVQNEDRRIVLYDCVSLMQYDAPFIEMYRVLDSYTSIWDRCQVILVEQQMAFGHRVNPMALKLGQHCQSFFIGRYGPFKSIIEFPSYHKTKVFERARMKQSERKKWAVVKAIEILTQRNDTEALQILQSRRKKDDLADCLLQIEAYRLLTQV